MIASLKVLLGEKVSFDPTVLEVHGKDTSYPEVHAPEAVVFAESVEDVLKVLAWCHKHQIPVIPFGTGSSLEGHITPISPAISLDFSHMNRILEVYPLEVVLANGQTLRLGRSVRKTSSGYDLKDLFDLEGILNPGKIV